MNDGTLKAYQLFVVHERWRLSAWCHGYAVDAGRKMLARVRAHQDPPGRLPPQRVRVQGPGVRHDEAGDGYESQGPILFENQGYELVFELARGWRIVRAWHKLDTVGLAFRPRGGEFGGFIDFGNDIGWFTLNLELVHPELGSETYSVSMEVHPRKLDLERDLSRIQRGVDEQYPLWLFSFAQKTEQGMRNVRRNVPAFPLLWLAHFAALKDDLRQNIVRVLAAPHRRLAEKTRRLRPEAVHRKLTPRQEERVATAYHELNERFRIDVQLRHLSVDTVENRFVKGVLRVVDRELARLLERLNTVARDEGLSAGGIEQLTEWRMEFQRLADRPLFREVGEFLGLSRESLVLQQRTGYAGVYRAWQQFKLYLEVFGRNADVSVKTINELYEVWCVLEVKRLLVDLGFVEVKTSPLALRAGVLELSLAEGESAAFTLQRTDASGQVVTVKLVHEPRYGRSSGTYLTRTISQRPDIVLEATFPNGERVIWIFDAKYRLATANGNSRHASDYGDPDAQESEGSDGRDLVPADAINQMHRYRDAILSAEAKEPYRFFRPVIGAFALYPGWYPAQMATTNPYSENIAEVGIGAFPLLPSQDPVWLRTFLEQHLLPSHSSARYSAGPDEVLSSGFARITAPGLSARRGSPLVLVAHVGLQREVKYLEDFKNGRAEWFHVRPVALERASVTAALLGDLTHCAVAVEVEPGKSIIRFVYELREGARLVERTQISPAQAGTSHATGAGQYWLFRLGRAEALQEPLNYVPSQGPYRVRFVPLDQLVAGAPWDEHYLHYEAARSRE